MRAVSPVPHETWLRIGVVRGGAIVEERWLRPGRSLSWGRSEKAEVVVASAPHDRAELIAAREGGWTIVASGIAGRGSRDGEAIDLARSGPFELGEGGRARIELGAVIVLVEARMRPPERAPTKLPGSARAAFGIDERFTAIALASLCLHSAFLLVAGEVDAPYVSRLEELDRIATTIFMEPEEPDAPPPDEPTEVADASETTPSDTSTPTPSTMSTPRSTRTAPTRSAPTAEEVARIQEEVGEQVEGLIGALGHDGALPDVLRGGEQLTSASEVMAQVRAAGDARPGPTGGLEIRDHVSLASLDACEGCGLTAVDTRDVREGPAPIDETGPRRPRMPTLGPPEPGPGPGFLPMEAFAREIARRRRRVQVCYEHALTSEPDLAGRLVVAMRVEQVGTLSHVRVEDGGIGSTAFQSCVVHAFDGFRTTTPPEGGPVEVSFPFVFAAQQ